MREHGFLPARPLDPPYRTNFHSQPKCHLCRGTLEAFPTRLADRPSWPFIGIDVSPPRHPCELSWVVRDGMGCSCAPMKPLTVLVSPSLPEARQRPRTTGVARCKCRDANSLRFVRFNASQKVEREWKGFVGRKTVRTAEAMPTARAQISRVPSALRLSLRPPLIGIHRLVLLLLSPHLLRAQGTPFPVVGRWGRNRTMAPVPRPAAGMGRA